MSEDAEPLTPGDEGPAGAAGVGENTCRRCEGSGQLNGEACPECGGDGVVNEGIGGG